MQQNIPASLTLMAIMEMHTCSVGFGTALTWLGTHCSSEIYSKQPWIVFTGAYLLIPFKVREPGSRQKYIAE